MPNPIVSFDEEAVKSELRELVRKTIEETINAMLDELDVPKAAWREDMQGNKKWDYEIVEDDNGLIRLVD